MTHQARAYPGFCSMKRLGVFLLLLDGMLVNRKVTPSIKIRRCPFIHLGGEGHCERKVSRSRTQHHVPSQRSNPNRSIRSRVHHHGQSASLSRPIAVTNYPNQIELHLISEIDKRVSPWTVHDNYNSAAHAGLK